MKRILYLDSHRLSVWRWRQGEVALEASYENTPEDLARFATALPHLIDLPLTLLANSPEEAYQQEIIPFLRGADREALIHRRCSQYFFATPLTAAIPLGYEKNRRRNERLLLTALTNPAAFEPWLTPLAQASAPLKGLVSLAQLGGPLLARLGRPPSRCLLLTVQDSSVRESFIVGGITLFSRVAPLPDSSIATTAASFAAEARKLHQYLLGQRLVGRNETLTAYVLAHPLAMPAVRNSCIDSGNLRFELIDNQQAARQAGVQQAPEDSRCEALFIHQLASQAPAQQFLAESLRHDYRLHLLKKTLLACSGLGIAAALLFAAWQFVNGYQLHHETASLATQESAVQQRYRGIAATFPQVQVDNDALRQIIDRYAELKRLQGGPRAALQQLSQVLDSQPNIEIDGIDWKQNSPDKKNGGEELISITGQVRLGAKTSPRQTIAAFEALVLKLRALPGIGVSVVRSPLDIESNQAVRSGKPEEAMTPHPFMLAITRKEAR